MYVLLDSMNTTIKTNIGSFPKNTKVGDRLSMKTGLGNQFFNVMSIQNGIVEIEAEN